ncbi:hypothetical protein HOD29_01225 [archaeon]|jgi:hypothetical protein|nr:hypothetical protein [Candidatus Woesearchaeota archaeon]MBT4375975.1 hypothetical protein [archaeon]
METNLFYIKVVGIIFNTATRQVLVGKSKGDENYSFLEGDLTHEQELDKCIKDTVTDKTGYIVHNLGSIYSENMLQDPTKVKLHFLCQIKGGEEKLGENVEELIWIKPSKVEEKLNVELPSRLKEYITNLE